MANEILNTLGLGDPTTMVANTSNSVTTVLLVILWVVIAGGVVWFALWFNSFKTTVIIREVTNKRRYVTSDKAKIKKLDGVEYYFLRRRKVYLNIPPPEALEITKKGRYFCEVYHNGEAGKNTGYQWIKDDTDDIRDLEGNDDTFRPLPTQRQSQLVNRIRRAESRKGKSLLENIMPIVQTTAIVIMVISIFLFYGELTKANVEAMEQTKAITNIQAKTTEQLMRGIDVLTGKLERNDLIINQDISLEEQVKPPEVTQ